MREGFPSRDLNKIVIRVPDGMREGLKHLAKGNNRSVNAELVFRLAKVLAEAGVQDQETVNAR